MPTCPKSSKMSVLLAVFKIKIFEQDFTTVIERARIIHFRVKGCVTILAHFNNEFYIHVCIYF